MRYPRWFAQWRLKVWDRRLALYRREWNRVTVADIAPSELDKVDAEMFWERLVTKAMAKRTKWRKRAGVRLAQGGPVNRGKPYIVGERGPELSDQDGRPGA